MHKHFTIWHRIRWTVADTIAITKRNLIRYLRLPQLLVFSTIQPIMFVLLFTYVFGGAIHIPGVSYINYLLPGILVQAVLFGSIQTGVGLADDFSRGMIDRFRSLPTARSAVITARTFAEIVRNTFVVLLMSGIGTLVGFRFQVDALSFITALALAVFFGFAFSWVSTTIGLLVKDAETAQVAGFIWVFPLVFTSSIFVPIETMPRVLEAFAKISPITVTVDAIRAYILGGAPGVPLLYSLAWIFGLLIIFVPLGIYLYKKTS